jgi:Protein of unknown function (DUF3828)
MSVDQREEASMKMNSRASFSRRHLALGFAAILAFPVAPVFAGREHRAREDAAKKFLGSIYQRYLGKSSAAAAGVPLTDAQSVRSYFTFALASLILEDRAAATKQGESPALGTDPFIGRPEWDVSDLSVDVKDTAGFKTVGTVTFINFGKPERVVLELLRSGKEWRIADIVWDSGSLRGLYRRKAAYDGEAVPETSPVEGLAERP